MQCCGEWTAGVRCSVVVNRCIYCQHLSCYPLVVAYVCNEVIIIVCTLRVEHFGSTALLMDGCTLQASKELLREHYADLKTKKFFNGLVDFMASGPVVCMVGCRVGEW